MSECSYYLSENKFRPIRPGSAGFPQPGHDVRLLDPETLREVAPGEEGMICCRTTTRACSCGTGTCPRKRRSCATTAGSSPATTPARRGRLHLVPRPQGRHHQELRLPRLAVRGRAGDEGASGGRRLRVHRRGGRAGQGAGGRVRDPAARAQPPTPTSCRVRPEHLAAYKAPKIVYLAHDFPRTKNGKILRREITPGRGGRGWLRPMMPRLRSSRPSRSSSRRRAGWTRRLDAIARPGPHRRACRLRR